MERWEPFYGRSHCRIFVLFLFIVYGLSLAYASVITWVVQVCLVYMEDAICTVKLNWADGPAQQAPLIEDKARRGTRTDCGVRSESNNTAGESRPRWLLFCWLLL